MSRLVPFRAKVPPLVTQRMDDTRSTTMYLVQTTGPTSFVVQEQTSDKKHKVLIGPTQSCSCGDVEVCIHILFVMLKVLRVPATNPIVWQKSLIDSEVDALLRGDYREKTGALPPTNGTGFLKKHKKDSASTEPQTEEEENDAQRHALVPGEVCAICQEDMTEDQPLTFCRKGCGNNFHIECMKVFGESRKQSKEHLICPLCRHDWGDLALTELKKEMDIANRAPNVHKNVSCKKCKSKPIRNERYRCVQCKNVDLCDRCFKMNAHINHSFVMKKMVADPWIPALRSTQARARNLADEIVDELQNRDLTTNDYDLLLQLDQRDKIPVQDFLLSILGGQKVLAVNAKSFGEPGAVCSVCRQSLRIQADVRSVICGHSFHESCLARSILSKVYFCPHPGCEYVLFPGMYYLDIKKKAVVDDGKMQQETNDSSAIGVSLCVMPLQQSVLTTGVNSKTSDHKKLIKRHKNTTSNISCTTPEVTGLYVGSAPIANSGGSHGFTLPRLNDKPKHLAALRSRTINQSRDSCSQQSIVPGSVDNVEPLTMGERPAPIDERLQHAGELRSEMKMMEMERHRKQRLEREERVRQNISSNSCNHLTSNVGLPSIGHLRSSSEERVPITQLKRSDSLKHPHNGKEQASSRRVGTGAQKNRSSRDDDERQETLLPELSIGGIRRV